MIHLVTAVIKPHRLADVKDALKEMGVGGMTVTEVSGFGRQGGHTETYRGSEYEITFVPKVRVEVLCDEVDTARVVDTVCTAAATGKIGDGKVWVTGVLEVTRIRTREIAEDAL
jgi:nitrogen regulatory protein P-II 1